MMVKTLATLAGLVLGPIITIVTTFLFHDPPRHDNWDLATPLLLIGGIVLAAIVGAVAGFLVGQYLQSGEGSFALATVCGGVTLSALIGLGVAFPGTWMSIPEFTPADARARKAWAARHGPPRENDGRALAKQVEGRLREAHPGGTLTRLTDDTRTTLRRTWYGPGPDSIAADGGYAGMDDGWRWELASEDPPRVIVFPDPVFGAEGPVFDVQRNRILRRERREAPGYTTEKMVPAFVRFHACVMRLAREARRDGRWDGAGGSFGDVLAGTGAATGAAPEGCGRLRVHERPEDPRESWVFDLYPEERSPNMARVELRATATGGETPFELAFRHNGMAYLVDEDGGWHMRAREMPTRADPPPPPCLFDPTIPCD